MVWSTCRSVFGRPRNGVAGGGASGIELFWFLAGDPMNPRLRLWHTAVVAMVVIVGFATVQTAQAVDEKRPSPNAAAPGEVQTLRKAYALLAVADHDYDGHRAMAMGAIDVACRLMGSDVRSEGVGHEQQGESDTQLKQAKALLETVRGSAAVAKNERAQRHVDRAIDELKVALGIK